MTQPLLSILIPITPDRVEGLQPLLDAINFGQSFKYAKEKNEKCSEWVLEIAELIPKSEKELIIYCDEKVLTIGEKREKLYKMATGKFSIQIDSDDLLAPNAIQLILEAIKSNPEIPVITFREKCMINGAYKSSNHSIRYNHWEDNADGFDYVRCPFYKDVIRTDIAKQVPFEHIRYNEDERFSYALKPWLTSEIHIDEELYYYIYNETSHDTRYGFV